MNGNVNPINQNGIFAKAIGWVTNAFRANNTIHN